MRTDDNFSEKLERLQRTVTESYKAMQSLNEQAANICVTLKAVAKETRLKILLQTLEEQEREASNLTLGTNTVVTNLKHADEEIEMILGK